MAYKQLSKQQAEYGICQKKAENMYYKKRERESHALNMAGKCLLGAGLGIGQLAALMRHFILRGINKNEREQITWESLWLANRLV